MFEWIGTWNGLNNLWKRLKRSVISLIGRTLRVHTWWWGWWAIWIIKWWIAKRNIKKKDWKKSQKSIEGEREEKKVMVHPKN